MRQRRVFAQLVSGSGIATLANAAAALLATKWLPVDDRGVMVAALTIGLVAWGFISGQLVSHAPF